MCGKRYLDCLVNYFHMHELSGIRNDRWGNYCDLSDIGGTENCRSQAYNSGILYEFHDEAGEVFCINLGNNYENIIASLCMSLLSASEVVLGNYLHICKLP